MKPLRPPAPDAAETQRLIWIIASAIPSQGPPDREDKLAAVNVLRDLNRAGYHVVKREKNNGE